MLFVDSCDQEDGVGGGEEGAKIRYWREAEPEEK